MNWDDDFWEDDPLVEAQESIKQRLVEDRIPAFRELLATVFPLGAPEEQLNRGPQTVARRVGDHWVGIVGATKPGDNEVTWDGFWRQNVAMAIGRNRPGGRRGGGATIEKATRRISTDAGAVGWLSWVHRNICKVSVEQIRIGLHPDNFMLDLTKTFRATFDLHEIDAKWIDVEDLIGQRLPWKQGATNLGALCTVFRNGAKIGTVGVKKKDDHWRYGGQIDISQLNPLFAHSECKFRHEVAVTACKTLDDAIERAERLYAHKLFDWLFQHCTNPGLRVER